MSTAPTTREWLRTAARRVCKGSGVLVARIVKRGSTAAQRRAQGLRKGIGGWLGESTGGFDTLVRWAFLAGGGLVAWVVGRVVLRGGVHAAAGARGALWLVTVVWLVAAYRAGGEPEQPKDAVASPEPDAGPGPAREEQPLPTVPRQEFVAMLHAEIGTGRAVHLAHLATVLARHYPEQSWDVPAVAALCAAHDVPVEPKVRAHGKGATRGVVRESLPPRGEFVMAPAVDVDVAGHVASTGPSTSTSTGPSTVQVSGGEKGFVTLADEANPHRTHVRWSA